MLTIDKRPFEFFAEKRKDVYISMNTRGKPQILSL